VHIKEDKPIQDKIIEFYTFQDWLDGRISLNKEGLWVDIYFNYRKDNPGKFEVEFKKVPANISDDEIIKIKAEQERIFDEGVNGLFKSLREDFIECFYNSSDRLGFLEKEMRAYDKLFLGEQYPLELGSSDADFEGRTIFFTPQKVLSIRKIYSQRILKGIRDYSMVRSHRCRMNMGLQEHELKQVEAYVKLWHWIKSYKKQYDIAFFKPLNWNTPVNEFLFIERMILDMETHSKLFHVYRLEENIEDLFLEREKLKDDDCSFGLPGEADFFERIFQQEINRIKSAIHAHAQSLNADVKEAYLSHNYQLLKSLMQQNDERKEHLRKIANDKGTLLIHAHYWRIMDNLKQSMEIDFKPYLNLDLVYNTDELKFERRILCSYYNCYQEIEKHQGQKCSIVERNIEFAQNLFDKFKDDYLEQYDYIAQKWIKKKKSIGYNVSEKDFIDSQIKRLGTLFKKDPNAMVLSAIDYSQSVYTFSLDFYDNYMKELFIFLGKLLQAKLDEIKRLNILPIEAKPSIKTNTKIENHLLKLDTPLLEEEKKNAIKRIEFLSGCNVHKQLIMTAQDYKRLVDYVLHLIEFEALPKKIKPIPPTSISTEVLRYTFYMLHKQLYGTNRIRNIWIDFLHSAFRQFESQSKTTTKTKFSSKPPLFDSDWKSMQR
jgi:hypothetical protein